ncbi:hypothetical protein PBCVNEJV4_268R [Paramecium bursaria Chlorella virus NE-JV-4]|uniref:Uncharacterized protein n=1 Tax=Paramecium bursaria Chlorella virus IL3A TaxID=46019 RepID=M1HUG8_PBCVI|nr:hypothetical protein PBCVIL3A_255R [Paramecium bursaria Chlorella virus IL3A]AGE57266.1 hypothetical protein PBCVNEJV4_268R [Paramecium bursaria Chlorella virus NE-JV-4]
MTTQNTTTPPKKIRKPYRGVRTFHNFTVDYSMERLIFTVDVGTEKLKWQVDKEYVRSYPNFQKISDYEMWEHYTYHVLPQIKQYYAFIEQYYAGMTKTEPVSLETTDVKSYL